jgi:hypothetical protein
MYEMFNEVLSTALGLIVHNLVQCNGVGFKLIEGTAIIHIIPKQY